MGYQSLSVNPILARIGHLVTPRADLPDLPDLPCGATWPGIHAYTLAQLVLTGAVFGLTVTVTAPAFPLVILALVPVRLTLMTRLWSRETLRAVDGWACWHGKPEDAEARPAAAADFDEEKGRP